MGKAPSGTPVVLSSQQAGGENVDYQVQRLEMASESGTPYNQGALFCLPHKQLGVMLSWPWFSMRASSRLRYNRTNVSSNYLCSQPKLVTRYRACLPTF